MKITIALAFIFLLKTVHPIHVSVTEIEFDEQEKELEIMMRIFLDDLEQAVRSHRKQNDLDLLNPPKELTTEKIIDEYLRRHVNIKLDGKSTPIRYLGQESEGEAMVCYLLVSNVKKWSSIEVTNSVLQELFDDQSNIVHVTVNENIKSMRLVKYKSSGSVSFGEQ